MNSLKPKKRSRLRIIAGMLYYRCKRYLEWYFSGKKYSKVLSDEALSYAVFSHKTPLLRELRNVDMWMQYNKVANLKIAVKRLDGALIKPGETFSYWKLVGKPTKRKGYMDGMVLFNRGFRAGVGGGLCQLSNLIYWMALHTPLIVTERYRHSFDVFPDSNRTQPFGSGATCAYNHRDLQLYNNTNDTYQLKLYMDSENLHGEWRSTKEAKSRYEVYEGDHHISHEFWGGYVRHNTINRKEYDLEGVLLMDEFLTENHAVMMYQPFLSESSSTSL
ncbi:MAG TPA: VanW family protein [Clostridia bacterium]|nr:VanW family protein [Clostridia bacterium]